MKKWYSIEECLPSYDIKTGKNLVDLFEVRTSDGRYSFAYYGVGGWCTNLSWYDEYMIKNVVKWCKV